MPLNSDDIVRELRLAKDYPHSIELFHRAADLIESLQAQLTAMRISNDGLCISHDTVSKRLNESQRRERAAVEDLEGAGACFSCKHFKRNEGTCSGGRQCIADGMRIFPCDSPGTYRIEIPDDGRNTYEWRGPQEDEEVE